MLISQDPVRHFFSLLFSSDSMEATAINTLFLRYLILAGIIIVLVAGGVIIGAIRFHSKKKQGEPPQITGNKNLEIAWTVIPAIILVFFFFLTLNTMIKVNKKIAKNRQPDVVIIAHQWWWDIRYPKYHIITANELHVPVGQNWLMRIESADVIHDWWVPALGRKVDAIPGRSNYLWMDANNPGVYLGSCNEYCGAQHANMRITVVAQTQDEFNNWVKDQQQVAQVPDDSLAHEGELIFQKKTCADCHNVGSTGPHVGPDLSHLGSRRTILSSMLPNTDANLTRWLHDPQNVKPGAYMPDFHLSNHQVKALVTYLEALK